MARLKVKQISDIQTYVQGLIDNDSDQNAGLIDALEASVDSLEAVAGGSVTADLTASVDSLEVVDTNQSTSIANNASSIANSASSIANNASSIATNATGIAENVKDIADLQTQADNNDADNLALTASVNSLELIDDGLATSITNLAASVATNDTRVDSILSNADVDLDQFTEVVAYVNSLDVLQGGELTDGLSSVNASIDSLEVVASAAITSIDALEAADVVINASIDSLETLAIDAFGAGVRIHQMGTVTGGASFTIPTAVDSSSDADCLVFVNGKGEQMLINGVNSNGWSSVDGLTFTLTGIGYNIDGEDDVYVVAPYAGAAETTGTGGGEDYEDFFNARKGE